MSYNRLSNSPFFKKLLTDVFLEVRHFLHLIRRFIKNFVNKSKYGHLLLHKFIKYFITGTKWANSLHIRSNYGHLGIWASKHGHLLLHKLIKYVFTATKWANIEFLTSLLQKVINRRSHEVRLFLHLIRRFIKIL